MKNKGLFQSFFILTLALLLLLTSTFAWLTISTGSKTDDFVTTTGKIDVNVIFEVKKNNSEYMLVKTQEEMKDVLTNSLPGDIFFFRLTVENKSSKDINIDIILGIDRENINEGYDLFDVFIFGDGRISISDGKNTIQQYIYRYDEKIDYFINNVVVENKIEISKNLPLAYQGTNTLEFTIIYDHNTVDIGYQGKLIMNGIKIYLKNGE